MQRKVYHIIFIMALLLSILAVTAVSYRFISNNISNNKIITIYGTNMDVINATPTTCGLSAHHTDNTIYNRTFTYKYNNHPYTIKFNITQNDLDNTIDLWQEKMIPPIDSNGERPYQIEIHDLNQDIIYDQILTTMHAYKTEYNLTDEEYLQALIRFIQTIPYQMSDTYFAKTPIRTIMDYSGDCDDKSVLLAGLLDKEGYQVSLIYVHLEGIAQHMGVGIKSNGAEYDGSGWTFIETTSYKLIGQTGVSFYTPFLINQYQANQPPTIYPIRTIGKTFEGGNKAEAVMYFEMNFNTTDCHSDTVCLNALSYITSNEVPIDREYDIMDALIHYTNVSFHNITHRELPPNELGGFLHHSRDCYP